MARQPEAKLVKKALAYLHDEVGGRWFKIHGGGDPFQEVGIPDILGCYKGMFIALEAKMPGGKVSPRQAQVIWEIQAAKGHSAVFESIEELKAFFAKLEGKG